VKVIFVFSLFMISGINLDALRPNFGNLRGMGHPFAGLGE